MFSHTQLSVVHTYNTLVFLFYSRLHKGTIHAAFSTRTLENVKADGGGSSGFLHLKQASNQQTSTQHNC